jgi:hypothetical protein
MLHFLAMCIRLDFGKLFRKEMFFLTLVFILEKVRE